MPVSEVTWAVLRERLEIPEDATPAQIGTCVEAIKAQAAANQTGTVAASGPLKALRLSADAPESVLLAATELVMLRKAKQLGMSASAAPREVRAAADAVNRVMASQAQARARVAAAAAVSAPSTPKPMTDRTPAPASWSRTVMASVPDGADPQVYSLNPAVDQAADSGYYEAAVRASAGRPVPTLFQGGDLPAYTRSGIDPDRLARVPWSSRHIIASAETVEEAEDLITAVSGPEGPLVSEIEHIGHPRNREYLGRVAEWVSAGMFNPAQGVSGTGQVMAGQGGPGQLTDEQIFAPILGPGWKAVR